MYNEAERREISRRKLEATLVAWRSVETEGRTKRKRGTLPHITSRQLSVNSTRVVETPEGVMAL